MIINNDTVELLRECSAGIKMGISAIDEVISKVKSIKLGQILSDYRTKHEMLGKEAEKILKNCGEKTKEPNVIAKGMSWMKTNAMLYVSEKDSTVSDLITDGCNMGVKSVNKYINKYDSADEKSKKLAEEIVKMEEEFADELSVFL